jgi:glycosyltransferase involved in cell wall biosynthesis/predicted ATP-grasp superfamily ATP-dependent carboligase
MKVFVTDGDQRSALAATKSLGKRGIRVFVGEERERSLASSSKYCSGHVTYPSPYRDPQGFHHFLLRFLKETQIDVVMPMTDVTNHLISQWREELEPYTRLPIPKFETFDFVSNKWALLKHARTVGIPIPRTHFIDRPEDLHAVLGQLEYPVVVKPGRSGLQTDRGWLTTSVHYAISEMELLRLYQEKDYLRYPSLIQERVIGPGLGLFLLFDRGEPVAVFGHRRLREKPLSGGVSVVRESVPVDPTLKEYAMQLLKPLGWHGVAMMEYKLDQRTGQPLLIEVNGRFWGSLQLAIDAGMDFPYLLYRLATEGHVEAPQDYQVGVKSRWFLGDLDHLLLRLFKKDRDLDLPPGFPSRARTLIDFLKFYSPDLHYEVLSLRDPKPFLYELSEYVRAFFHNGQDPSTKVKTILHLIECSGPGGAETILMNLVKSLDQKKYRSVICLLEDGWLNARLRERGFDTVIIPQRKGLHPGWIYKCIELIRQRKISLLHAHEFTLNTYGSIVSKLTGVPIITTVHGKNYYWEKWRRRVACRFAARQSKMVAVSEDTKNFLMSRVGVKKEHLTTIHNGIDINTYSCAPEAKEARNGARGGKCGPVIGTVGNLYPVKGQTYLLKALPMVIKSFPNVTCMIAGRGELLGQLKAEAAELGLDGKVKFLGFRDDIPELLQELDIFVLPSLSEGLPLSALEAMAAGKPVVATDVGGTHEAVIDRHTGLLVPPEDPQALSEGILCLLRQPELAKIFGDAGRKRVEQIFSLETMIKRYEELYDELSLKI